VRRVVPTRPARRWPGAWFPIAVLLLVNGAFALNNLAPYLGLNYAGAMTMYSGLGASGDDHLLMPKIRLGDADTYVSIVRATPSGGDRDTPSLRLLRTLRADAVRPRPLAHLDFVRYHVSRACGAAADVGLELVLLTEAGQRLESEDACADPAMLRYAVVTSYPRCKSAACARVLERWREEHLAGRAVADGE
jgi:hypothetical protein